MSQMTYSIIFTGTNLSAPAANSAKQGLVSVGQAGSQSMNNVRMATDGATASMNTFSSASYRGFRSLQMGAMMGVSLFGTFYMRQMALENSQDSLTQSQERYTESVLQYGAGSKQALTALNQLERAQRSYQSAQTMSTLMTVSAGVQLVGFGAQILYVLPKINTLITTLKSLAITQTLLNALKGPVGWAMLAGGVVAAGAGVYAVNNMLNNNGASGTPNVNVNVNSQQDIYLQYLQRVNGNSVTSAGG